MKVDDFVMVMQDGFQRRGIAAEVYDDNPPASCQFVVDYTALRSWDFKPYLPQAEIRITEQGRLVASAIYHLNGKGYVSRGQGQRAIAWPPFRGPINNRDPSNSCLPEQL